VLISVWVRSVALLELRSPCCVDSKPVCAALCGSTQAGSVRALERGRVLCANTLACRPFLLPTVHPRAALGKPHLAGQKILEVLWPIHRITESLRLEETSEIKSNRPPNIIMPAKPCPQVPHPHVF